MKIKHSNILNKPIYILLILVIVILDIFSKYWILNNIEVNQVQYCFTILNFFHVHNYGAAFSFLSNRSEWTKWFLFSVSICTILFITKTMLKSTKIKKNQYIAYTFIVSGAIGNLIDRIIHGFVIDFIDLHVNDLHFATFNIADISIFIGVVILIRTKY
jgi:signal peptidase II